MYIQILWVIFQNLASFHCHITIKFMGMTMILSVMNTPVKTIVLAGPSRFWICCKDNYSALMDVNCSFDSFVWDNSFADEVLFV